MAERTLQQVAALCWRRRKGTVEVLLVTSRETRRWVIPKGWPMDGLADYNAARREAFEEAGVEGHMRREPLGTFFYEKRGKKEVLPVTVTVAQRGAGDRHGLARDEGTRTQLVFHP